MPVTVINQPTTATARTNWILGLLTKMRGETIYPSPVPYPHNALQSKPWFFERTYNVTITRLTFPNFPTTWPNQEHWSPLCLKRNGSESKRTIIYYHGGGFVNEMISPQWSMIGSLSHDLEADIVIQTYTMPPHGGIHDNIDKLTWIYSQIRATTASQNQELILFGDSAGGSISAAMLLALHDKSIALPNQVLLLSPCLMMDFDRTANRAIEPNDPVLTIERFSGAMHGWSVGAVPKESLYIPFKSPSEDVTQKMQHPYAAPLFGDWTFMAREKCPITICQGTYDVLLPEVDRFVDMCREKGLEVSYIRANQAAHDYPLLANVPGSWWLAPDSVEGMRLMVECVKKYSSYS